LYARRPVTQSPECDSRNGCEMMIEHRREVPADASEDGVRLVGQAVEEALGSRE